jgi:demethylmenaquinone methyltransferase/2-methoxy-6-polyprenyl-1,4-benzoquinol methylase
MTGRHPCGSAAFTMHDPVAVQSMFGRIASRYDVANHVLCGGIDIWWRRRLVATVKRGAPRSVLDLATGSGDVAFALGRGLPAETTILGMDFCQPMLDQAEAKKAAAAARYPNLTFVQGDGLALPLADGSFDAVTISFGLRNLADRALGLREMLRVLRPGGQLVVLEFSQPYAWFRPLYFFYLRRVLPRVAGWVTGDRAAYEYLNNTIAQFPGRAALAVEIAAAGFTDVQAEPLTLGTVALHSGRKPAR